MAKITDSTTLDGVWLASKWNTKRTILAINAGGAEEAGLLFLESVDGSGTLQGGLYLWADSAGKLRYSTSRPTDEDADGYALDNTSVSSMVNKQLSNLASVAVNTNIVSDTDSTDNLGSSSKYWANTYTDKLYLYGTTSYFTGTSATATLTGALVCGADGTGSDVTLYGATSGSYARWTKTTTGTLTLTDDAKVAFGDADDFTMKFDATNMLFDNKTANTGNLHIGSAVDTDIRIESQSNAGKDITWDASAYTWTFLDATKLAFGTSDDFVIAYDGTNTLNIDPLSASDVVRIGETTVADLYLDGTNYDINWDASESELVFDDGAKLVFGGSVGAGTNDLVIASGGAVTNFTFGATSNGIVIQSYAAQTVSVLDIDNDTAEWTGADDVGLLHIRSDAALGNAGASLFYIDNSGKPIASAEGFMARLIDTSTATASTYGVEISSTNNNPLIVKTGAVGVVPLTLQCHTNATAALMYVDGVTKNWIGADDTGMVHIENDTANTHIGATQLLVESSYTPKAASEGYLARFLSTGTATTDASAVEIEVPVTQPALALNSELAITGQNTANHSILTVTGNDATNNSDTVDFHGEGTGSVLKITCDDADSVGMTAVAATSQTTALVHLDGSTGSWLGADGVGMLDLDNDGAFAHANSSLLLITNTGVPQNDSRGHCLRIVDSGNAAAGTAGYAAYISATDATVEALYVDAGEVLVDEYLKAGPTSTTGGLVTAYHTADLTATPTDAEFDTGFGAKALGKAGFVGVAEDSSDGKTYLVVSDGTTWHYVALTAAA